MNRYGEPIQILLVEDSPGDVRLTVEAFREFQVSNDLHVVGDGVEAMRWLRGEDTDEPVTVPRADLVLLDLNLPRMDGREVLAEIKGDAQLQRTPVVVLTTSSDEADVLRSYDLHANAYITKPVDLDQFIEVVRSVEEFWLTIVRLPREE